MKKILKCLAVLGLISSLNASSYLTKEQEQTINSYKSLVGKEFIELNYTADYKLGEFMDAITSKKLEIGEDMRKVLQQIVVPGSKIVPKDRLSNSNPGCSSVVAQDIESKSWLLGRNYDLDIRSNGTALVIHTAPKNGYKSVGVADAAQFGLGISKFDNDKELLLYSPYVTMDGVNEKGFAISIMVLDQARVVQNDSKKPSLPSSLLVRYLLDNASSVDNAIELLNKLNLKPDYLLNTREFQEYVGDRISFHWALTDVSGNRAIIEYVNGKMNVIKNPVNVEYDEKNYKININYNDIKKPYLISTNFFVSKEIHTDVKNPDSGLWRYATLQNALEKNNTPSKKELIDMMKSAKFFMNDNDIKESLKRENKDIKDPKNWEWITIWTDILDTKEKSLKVFYKENYDKEYNFSVK